MPDQHTTRCNESTGVNKNEHTSGWFSQSTPGLSDDTEFHTAVGSQLGYPYLLSDLLGSSLLRGEVPLHLDDSEEVRQV